jgi:hypothetical protein
MKLLKQNKQSAVIVKQVSGTIVVTNVRSGISNNNNPISHVTFIDDEGNIATICVGGHEYKCGPATILQTEWSKESQFGAGVSTKINCI